MTPPLSPPPSPNFPAEPPEKSQETHSLHFPPVTGDQSLNLSNAQITHTGAHRDARDNVHEPLLL